MVWIDGTMPIQHDFTAAETRFARVAYTTYCRGRIRRPWDQMAAHERFRWQLVGWAFTASPRGKAEHLRATYHIGKAVQSWADVGHEYRRRWSEVTTMLEAERIRMRAAAAMVVTA